ncbi:DUF882 domain-containing protein [Hyphomicrobium sp. 1Nfss2.1]|uniref:DUF882 domain-containing protein n=1 Tax=Hyphomicrobium sp. 1Nfss2.1 TaxID=3413936 RepID=UPI003C7A0297
MVSRKKAILGALTAALLGMSAGSPDVVAAFGSTRTISMHHIHTDETITITYKKNGKYDPEALKKLNWFLRDWRQNKAIEIDPKTIDLLWEMHTELGSKVPIDIICGYRSEATNSMLRKTRGGQAKKSKHMTGQAIDATFPDIPLKQLRWSAAIREVGGIGYYPTSGVPFVHVDTGPVRAWPRLPRQELAMLFPSGRTKHHPSSGGDLTREDVRNARQNSQLRSQMAAFFERRIHPRTEQEIMMAEAGIAAPAPVLKAAPMPVARPAPEVRVASLEQQAGAPQAVSLPTPKLAQAPRLAVRPPSEADRGQLNQLVTLASLNPSEVLGRARPAVDMERRKLDAMVATASLGSEAPAPRTTVDTGRTAALSNRTSAPAQLQPSVGENWAPAPEFDDDHPEELSYRPFPVAPLLTQSASADDEALVKLVHPDLHRTLDLLEDKEIVLPMRLRPGNQVSHVMWAQQFQGGAVDFTAQHADEVAHASGLASRAVRTTAR